MRSSVPPLVERAKIALDTFADHLRQDGVARGSATIWPQLVGAWSQLP